MDSAGPLPSEPGFSPRNTIHPSFAHGEIATFLRERYGLSGTLKDLRSERDQVLRLDAAAAGVFTLRISHSDESATNLLFQNGALNCIAARDPELPVPRIVANLSGLQTELLQAGADAHPVRLFSYLPGVPAAEVVASTALRRSIGTTLARLDRALADYRPASAGEPFLWNVVEATRLRPLLSTFSRASHRHAVEDVFRRFEADVRPRIGALPWQVIHNDFHARNVLVHPSATAQVVGVIDFGDLVLNPRIADLAIALARQVRHDHPLSDAFDIIDAYEAVQPLEADEKRALHSFVCMRLALRMTIHSWRRSVGDRRPGSEEVVESEYRLLKRLSRPDATRALGAA